MIVLIRTYNHDHIFCTLKATKGNSLAHTWRMFFDILMKKVVSKCRRVGLKRTVDNGPRMSLTWALHMHRFILCFLVEAICSKHVKPARYIIYVHAKEAYVLNALLSFGRRYWRKAVQRNTKTTVAEQLKVVLKPNPRRSRKSCRKSKKGGQGGNGMFHIICYFNFSINGYWTYIDAFKNNAWKKTICISMIYHMA